MAEIVGGENKKVSFSNVPQKSHAFRIFVVYCDSFFHDFVNSIMGANTEHLQKFQSLLREIFQFDCADLDFGIYRIMNYKRDIVEKFISSTLPGTIEKKMGG